MPQEQKEYFLNYIDSLYGVSELGEICRPMFHIKEFCYMVSDIMAKLGNGKILLDVGAGNGLIDVVLSPHFEDIYAIEPLKLFDKLVDNTKLKKNIHPIKGYAEKITFKDVQFDRVLMYGVSYIWTESIVEVFDHIEKYLAPQARILIGEIDDAQFKEEYIKALPDILKKKNIPQATIDKSLEKNKIMAWHHYEDLAKYFNKLGFKTKRLPANPLHLLHEIKFDLLAER